MIVSLQCLELKGAFIILSLMGSHSSKVLAFCLEITRATPRMCVSPCLEYSMVEPSWVTCHPDLVHRHLLIPRLSSLYLFISQMTCTNFEVSFIVRTFHVCMLMLVLGPSRLSVAHLPSWYRLSPGVFILPGWLKSAMGSLVWLGVCLRRYSSQSP